MASPAMDAAKPKMTSSSVAATISESPKPIWQNIQYNDLSQRLEIVNLDYVNMEGNDQTTCKEGRNYTQSLKVRSIEVYGQMENDGGTVVIDR